MARPKILLADSDARTGTATAKALHACGFDVVSANDAVHAVNMARIAKPEVIVVSERLAGGGGAAAIRRIRCNVYTAHTPAIGLASSDGGGKELRAAGAQESLRQPVDAAALQAAIERHRLQSLDFTEAPAAALRAPERLAAVDETALVDSPPEPKYDGVSMLAARLLGAPTALITLVTGDRQFFKSQTGLAQPWARERQTRLSHSFCQWVVAGKDAVVVEDANSHPILKRNLAIKDLGVVAYAGVPIVSKKGEALGSMCAIDSKSRSWSEEDLATLSDLARIVESYASGQTEGTRGAAVLAATRLLRRHGAGMGDAEREALLAIIEEAGAPGRL